MIPRFKYYFYPCLSALADGGEHGFSEIKDHATIILNLTAEDLKEKLSSGTCRHNDRCSWALSYLKKLNFVSFVDRKYKITPAGIEALNKYGENFDLSVVRDLEGFVKSQHKEDSKGFWIPSHYTATGKYVPGYVSQWEYKGRQKFFATQEEALAYMESKKKTKKTTK